MATAFWIASGKEYVAEARRSAESVYKHMPDLRRVLFEVTDVPGAPGPFHEIQALPPREHDWWYLDAARYFGHCMNLIDDVRILYLDTDTWMCHPVYDLLTMLERFDFVGCHAPGRVTCGNGLDLPAAFPEINIGVLAMQRTPRLLRVLDDWYQKFRNNPAKYRNNDQGPLREALWNSRLAIGIAPPEYNCRWGFGGFARYPVKVLHGRPQDGNYYRVCRELNRKDDLRGWRRGDVL